jgi:cob(I)alamin adenosyltransferase
MIHVYTGNGKGKTTAAIGLALRAFGRGKRVRIIQFMKKGEYGEIIALKTLGIEVEQFGRPELVDIDNPTEADFEQAEMAVKRAMEAVSECDLLILDEINVALDFGLIEMREVLEIMEKSEGTELVLTGRNARKEVIDAADYVTEMREIKHPYSKGMGAREGVEY